MGYYTRYDLSWVLTEQWTPPAHEHPATKGDAYCRACGRPVIPDVERLIREKLGEVADYALDGENRERIKWYEHEEDMLKLSLSLNGIVFRLYGYGEEHGDEWVKFFLNGKKQIHEAPTWTPPDSPTESIWVGA
jgi:hypothetical protein